MSLGLMDTNCLINAGRNVKTPFRLQVKKPDNEITEIDFVRVLRLLPTKRIVALARDEGQPILVKTFLGRHAVRNAKREINGVGHIVDAGVRTPKLMWEGTLVGGGRLLAFEFLPDAISLFEQLQRSENQRFEVLSSVMEIMAKLHDQGVIQKDIHLANFLLSDGEVHTIDGGGIRRKTTQALDEGPSITNLALFFAQFLARHDELVPSAFACYEMARGWNEDPRRFDRLTSEIFRSRETRKRAYIGKTFRDCTRFVCYPSFTRFMVCERGVFTEEMQALLEEPDAFIDNGSIIKRGNSSTVSLVHLSDRSLVVKRYNIKGPFHGLRRAFRKSRAWISWTNAFLMEFLDIPALKPVALIENRLGPFRSSAYLITEYVEGPDALECLRKIKTSNGELEALVNILHKLSESQISHGDLKATNFLMSKSGPVMIDLDAMREHKNSQQFARAFKKDLERFMENWRDNQTLTSQLSGLLSELNYRYGARLK